MDITMCNGGSCPLKETCLRYKAKPSDYWQAYFIETPFVKDKCEYYWEASSESKSKSK